MEITYREEKIQFDTEDLPIFLSRNWSIILSTNTKYLSSCIKGVHVYFHRLILNYTGPLEIDHIDRNGLNNQKENLRIVTRSINKHNTKTWSSTGFQGVYKKRSNYMARISKNRKEVYLGTYPSIIEAAIVRDQAAILLYGENATLNFPENKELYLKELSEAK